MPIRRFKRSFQFRLFSIFAGIVLVFALFFALAIIAYQKQIVLDDLEKEGKMVSSLLGAGLKPGIFAENPEMLKDVLKGTVHYRNVSSVTVFNARGERIYGIRRDETAAPAAGEDLPDFASITFTPGDGGLFYSTELSDSIDVVSPVFIEVPENAGDALYFDYPGIRKKDMTIGYVHICLSKDSVRKEEKRIVLRAAGATLLSILAGLIVLLVSTRLVTVPLSSLTDHVRRYGSGEAVERIEVKTDDEVGRLAEAFNTMSENLRKREEEQSLLQNRLRQSEKLESVGRLARGIAHDFNNILSTVQGSVYLLEKKFSDHSGVMHSVEQIQKSLSRARALIQRIIAFSRAQVIETRPVELNKFIGRLGPVVAGMKGEAVELRIGTAPYDLVIQCDPLQMEQLIINLASNAIDAMPDGGVLHIRTEQGAFEGLRPEDGVAAGDVRYAVVRVSDTGTGIEEGTKDKIFEPFFTTKEKGKGNGLGLSIVYGIVEQHKGYLDVVSAPGQGTTFSVYIPLIETVPETQDNNG